MAYGGGGFPSRCVQPLVILEVSPESHGAACCRQGLSTRSYGPGGGHEQVSIAMPGQFDFDSEVEGLRSQVGRLKEVRGCTGHLVQLDMLCITTGAPHLQVASAIGEESKLHNSAIAGLVSALPQPFPGAWLPAVLYA